MSNEDDGVDASEFFARWSRRSARNCRRVFIAWPSLRGPDAPVYCCMGHFTASTRRRRPALN
jgi:hypothetical protein